MIRAMRSRLRCRRVEAQDLSRVTHARLYGLRTEHEPPRRRHLSEEIAPGTCKIVTVKGREIGIFHVNDEFFALINRCPHQGAQLCRGALLSRPDAPARANTA